MFFLFFLLFLIRNVSVVYHGTQGHNNTTLCKHVHLVTMQIDIVATATHSFSHFHWFTHAWNVWIVHRMRHYCTQIVHDDACVIPTHSPYVLVVLMCQIEIQIKTSSMHTHTDVVTQFVAMQTMKWMEKRVSAKSERKEESRKKGEMFAWHVYAHTVCGTTSI